MALSSADPRRTYRKGETIFSSSEPCDRVFLLQSGLVSLFVQKGEDRVEVAKAAAPQIIGEEALWGGRGRDVSAVALNDTQAIELSVAEAKSIIEGSPGIVKHLLRSVLKRQKDQSASVLAHALEEAEGDAFPNEAIHRVFAVIYHAAISTGKGRGDRLTVVWPAFRKYCHWGLRESPVRLERAIRILAKLGYAELEMVESETGPDAPPELGFVHFTEIHQVQSFYRYYQGRKNAGVGATIEALEELRDLQLQSHLAILKEIRAWNESAKGGEA